MAVNNNPVLIGKSLPVPFTARLTGAVTDRTGTGATDLVTCGADGCIITEVRYTPAAAAPSAATSAKVGLLWVTDAAGANPRLVGDCKMVAVSVNTAGVSASETTNGVGRILFPDGLRLRSGQKLQCAITVRASANDDTDVVAIGGDTGV